MERVIAKEMTHWAGLPRAECPECRIVFVGVSHRCTPTVDGRHVIRIF